MGTMHKEIKGATIRRRRLLDLVKIHRLQLGTFISGIRRPITDQNGFAPSMPEATDFNKTLLGDQQVGPETVIFYGGTR